MNYGCYAPTHPKRYQNGERIGQPILSNKSKQNRSLSLAAKFNRSLYLVSKSNQNRSLSLAAKFNRSLYLVRKSKRNRSLPLATKFNRSLYLVNPTPPRAVVAKRRTTTKSESKPTEQEANDNGSEIETTFRTT